MKRKNKISLRPPENEFNQRYYKQNIDVEKLANLWGVQKQTVYNWAYQYRNKTKE